MSPIFAAVIAVIVATIVVIGWRIFRFLFKLALIAGLVGVAAYVAVMVVQHLRV